MSNQDKPVTLVYTNYGGETSERTITPIKPWFGSTEWHPEPQWLLTAFDHEKQANRDFALKDFGYPSPSPRAQALEPDLWAVHSKTGVHIGLWPIKAHADEVLREYEGGTITPLYRTTHDHEEGFRQGIEAAAKLAESFEETIYSEGMTEDVYYGISCTVSQLIREIRALSCQPVADGLPQDVINLVIAARDAFDAISGCGIGAEIEADLDKALKAFASRVPYENEPDALPASPGASE